VRFVTGDQAHSQEQAPSQPSLIDPALGLDLRRERTIASTVKTVDVGIPAHNEAATVAQAVVAARAGLRALGVEGNILVAASACTDDTAAIAAAAGAEVLEVGIGKGVAVQALIEAFDADALCLLDADLEYFGDEPLVATLARPIVSGVADATLADLYWRPIYPQLWLYGFFAPLAGELFPEALTALGHSPWAGQRAATAALWTDLSVLPQDFTVDLAINLQWVLSSARVVSVPTDDWVNPQRPKPDLMTQELTVILDAAESDQRLHRPRGFYEQWFSRIHRHMAEYRPVVDDPARFERQLMRQAITELRRHQ
jgi:glucosyl-3-phosphoglycerate synthase